MNMSGLELARTYYHELVTPLLADRWPGMRYAAARLGSGSDVLGLDDTMSQDHDWGLRLTLLVDQVMVEPVTHTLEETLPEKFMGAPTHFVQTWTPEGGLGVEVATPEGFALSRLGVDASRPLGVTEWLSLTGQAILEVTAGPVFVDTAGTITAIRDRLQWYPDDVWRYVIAADWARAGQELPIIGRAGARGDDLGSRLIAARLARTAMHLGFLLERRWPPYSKWYGAMFAALPNAGAAYHALSEALAASSWEEREAALAAALDMMSDLQASLGLPSESPVTEPFHDRPFRGLTFIAEQVHASIVDSQVRALPLGVGSIEQWVDNVPMLVTSAWRNATVRAWRNALACDASG